MWLIPLVLLCQLRTGEFSITFPNSSEPNELVRIHDFYQPSPLSDSVANLGIHAVADLLSSESNVVISPLNIFSCLDLLQLGAAGDTKEEINQIVGHSTNEDVLNKVWNALHGTVHASAVFFHIDIVPKANFVEESFARHQAEVLNLDFTAQSYATSIINSWVALKTNGTIQDILQQDLDASTKLVVVTALIFNGKWLHPFSPQVTETGKFMIDDHNFVNVPIMHLEAYLPFMRRKEYNVLGLPYKDGSLVMYIILPHKSGIGELKKVLFSFSPTDLKNFALSSVLQRTFVEIPKFKIEGRVSLKDPLTKQGMRTSFSSQLANFTNFSENQVDGVYISDIYHRVHFEVNEHETIASAASAASFTRTRYFEFKATRPFIFAIADKSGLLLFMGAVIRPE